MVGAAAVFGYVAFIVPLCASAGDGGGAAANSRPRRAAAAAAAAAAATTARVGDILPRVVDALRASSEQGDEPLSPGKEEEKEEEEGRVRERHDIVAL